MTDNEIIKALEQCGKGKCVGCPCINDSENCLSTLTTNALTLINRQKEEIERLKKENEFHRKTITENAQKALEVTLEEIEKAKSEAYREFALKTKILLETKAVLYSLSDRDCEFAINQATALKAVDTTLKELTKKTILRSEK